MQTCWVGWDPLHSCPTHNSSKWIHYTTPQNIEVEIVPISAFTSSSTGFRLNLPAKCDDPRIDWRIGEYLFSRCSKVLYTLMISSLVAGEVERDG